MSYKASVYCSWGEVGYRIQLGFANRYSLMPGIPARLREDSVRGEDQTERGAAQR